MRPTSWRLTRECRWRLIFGVAVATIFVALPAVLTSQAAEPGLRQSSNGSTPSVRSVVIPVNKSKTVSFEMPFKSALIGNPAIADVTPLTDRSLYIQGKAIGTTNISVVNEKMQMVELLDLEVTVDTRNLEEKIRRGSGSNSIHASSSNGEVMLTGMVRDAVTADRVLSIAKSIVPGSAIVNAMTVAPSQQVMLKVRFLEAARSAERDLGLSWFATNANGTRGVSTGNNVPVVRSESLWHIHHKIYCSFGQRYSAICHRIGQYSQWQHKYRCINRCAGNQRARPPFGGA